MRSDSIEDGDDNMINNENVVRKVFTNSFSDFSFFHFLEILLTQGLRSENTIISSDRISFVYFSLINAL